MDVRALLLCLIELVDIRRMRSAMSVQNKSLASEYRVRQFRGGAPNLLIYHGTDFRSHAASIVFHQFHEPFSQVLLSHNHLPFSKKVKYAAT
jgi:hypothetical protein